MSSWAPSVAALGSLLLVVLLRSPRRPRRRPAVRLPARRRGGRVTTTADELAWLDALVAELSGGREPSSALVVASAPVAAFPEVVAAARTGGDIPAALRAVPGSSVVAGVAACWEVAAGSGAGLAASLASLADAARETERVRDELRAGLAEPRATALVLALLPVVGLALGTLLGAEPVQWLMGTPPGWLVLAAGAALEVAGAAWAWQITRSLEAAL